MYPKNTVEYILFKTFLSCLNLSMYIIYDLHTVPDADAVYESQFHRKKTLFAVYDRNRPESCND